METDVINRDQSLSTVKPHSIPSPLPPPNGLKQAADSTIFAVRPTSSSPVSDKDRRKHQLKSAQEQEHVVSQQVCTCLPVATASTDSQPTYQHLGAASSVQDLRRCLETRLGLPTAALRIEIVAHSEREGSTERGCPAAKWVLRRVSEQEKFLALARVRQGHACATAVIVVALVSWEGIPKNLADQAFDYLSGELPHRGIAIERRCAANESRTCGCQGFDDATCGASYSFGCSWSMFHNACKFARTREQARKFRLRSQDSEIELASRLNCLADVAGRVLEAAAPDAFKAQVQDSQLAADCRLGSEAPPDKRPFSGVTACLDFCMHAHKDAFALDGGCNVVVTLASSRSSDEQLHVLPGYMPHKADEFGSEAGQQERIVNGLIQEQRHGSIVTRVRASPMAPCAIRKKIKKSAQQQAQQKLQQSPQKQFHHQKAGKAVTTKEEHSPASIDSGFESIKSNRSPDKDDQQHLSPPMTASLAPVGILPPIASWFRKSTMQWTPPPQQQLQRYQQQQLQQMIPRAPPPPPTHALPPSAPPPSPMSPSTGYRDTRGVASETQLLQQDKYVQYTQQHQTNRSPQLQFQPRGPGAEFAHPHPPPPMPPSPQQLPQPQQQTQPQPLQHGYQQMGSWHGPMQKYQPQQHHHPGYMPRYPVEHPDHQYPGGYPGQWRPHYPQHGYYNQHQQSRGWQPPQYRQYHYPMYQHNSVQHSAYDMNYPQYQPYYHQQKQQYSQNCPQNPAQQHQLQQQQQPQQQNQQQQQQQIANGQLKQELPQHQGSTVQSQQSQPTKRRSSESAGSEKESVGNREFLSDGAELFRDKRMGGLAIALTHGSVLIEAAKHDTHATTALTKPDRNHPSSMSLVFFQQKNLCYAHHGYNEYAEKMRLLRLRRAESNEAKVEAREENKTEIKVDGKSETN